MISPLDSKILDRNSENLGISVDALMENAGAALADVVVDLFDGQRILFVCGTGNNGGDGFAAANILGKKNVTVSIFSAPKTDAAKKQYSKLSKKPIKFKNISLDDYDVIVDCVLGTGIRGDVKEPYAEYIDAINSSKKPVIACDVPSGFGTAKHIRPKITVTFDDLKIGMNHRSCGNIVVADIGIPKDAYNIVGPGDMLRYPIPNSDSHKGQNGRLLIIGGGPYVGAPAMAGMAALRTGVDLVHIAVPESCFIPVASMSPSFIMHSLPGNRLSESSVDDLLALSKDVDAVLIGPGLGLDQGTKDAVVRFAKECDRPMVVDADGITALAGLKIKSHAGITFTPHHSEFKRLSGEDADEGAAKRFASKYKCTVVLKGPTDIISDGKTVRRNITGTAAMTVGGTGDALAGSIAALIAKGMTPLDSGCLGTYICGKAGELAFRDYSYGMTAPDLIEDIAKVIRNEIKG